MTIVAAIIILLIGSDLYMVRGGMRLGGLGSEGGTGSARIFVGFWDWGHFLALDGTGTLVVMNREALFGCM